MPAGFTVAARWLLTAAGPPVPHGAVTIFGGRITRVGPAAGVRVDLDCGDAVITPGFVNAHVHLDLTGARGLTPPDPTAPFPDWLGRVIAYRRSRTPGQIAADIRAGLTEATAAGTTTLGDIAADGASFAILAASPIRAVVFRELIGLHPDRAAAILADADAWLATHPPAARCRPGLSPHAPYSVGRDLFRGAAALAARHGVGVQCHVAESSQEGELLAAHAGPFVPFLASVGAWHPAALAPDFDWVLRELALAPSTAIAHATYLDPASVRPNQVVVHCPRTHAAFGRPDPIAGLLAHGVRVALGTDGLTSNPDLDILAEARFLARLPSAPLPDIVLNMLTRWGADALGLGGETGTLEVGRAADLVVTATGAAADPYAALFHGPVGARLVMAGGGWVGGPPPATTH